MRDHLANEERLLGALSSSERAQLTRLLRKLLVSEPFAALDPTCAGERNGRAIERQARRRRTHRR